MFLFWNVCSQLEQRGCGWVIAKGKCYILMEAVRGAILLKHISFAFFPPNFSITSELGRHIDVTYVTFTCVHSHINYCPHLKALWLNTVTLVHLKTFFFTINNLRSLSPIFIGSMALLWYTYGEVRDAEEVTTAFSLLPWRPSVRPTLRMQQLGCLWADYREILHSIIKLKLIKILKVG